MICTLEFHAVVISVGAWLIAGHKTYLHLNYCLSIACESVVIGQLAGVLPTPCESLELSTQCAISRCFGLNQLDETVAFFEFVQGMIPGDY